MANPQAENGHTDIANEIVERLMRTNLNKYESRILWAVWRKTYGYHKKRDWIANSQFVEMTGISRQNVNKTVNRLIRRNMISKKDGEISFQKNWRNWKEDVVQTDYNDVVQTDYNQSEEKDDDVVYLDYNMGKKQNDVVQIDSTVVQIDSTVVQIDAHKRKYTKENIQKKVLSKDNTAQEPFGSKEIFVILNTYEKYMGHKPTDKRPRFIAQNLRKALEKMIAELKETDFTGDFNNVVDRAFTWYTETYQLQGDTLDVVYRKIKNLLIPATIQKYVKQS